MDYYGLLWTLHGLPWTLHGLPWNTMDYHGLLP